MQKNIMSELSPPLCHWKTWVPIPPGAFMYVPSFECRALVLTDVSRLFSVSVGTGERTYSAEDECDTGYFDTKGFVNKVLIRERKQKKLRGFCPRANYADRRLLSK
jgi:hypothetical protein